MIARKAIPLSVKMALVWTASVIAMTATVDAVAKCQMKTNVNIDHATCLLTVPTLWVVFTAPAFLDMLEMGFTAKAHIEVLERG
ncbi:unnamed protein product [Acanthoscelides obtectus]|uniref:Uncharacterized protein n=1 Tax=Acanthoscelides obtectus TaxID=200917 RepID=A0A9P0L8U0_ACAOB|nr:unnamed protein product [Acanthoscelides obtectus]CAK1620329.1 hypothetical protein AOBTE_LOCUS314 [Acanthoscelides obtectus]